MTKKTTTNKTIATITKILTPSVIRAGKTYAEAILEACEEHGIPPHGAIEDTDSYPKLAKEEQIEFAIGWFHGAADALGLEPVAMWDRIIAELGAKKAKRAA
jgi:hypothetical protein